MPIINQVKSQVSTALTFILTAVLMLGFLFTTANAATLLTDDFTGTTIDTLKWTEIDSAGAGGTSGDIQQNGTLTAGGSFISSIWGNRALVSAETFDSDGLEISANITRNSDALLGYGDHNFQSAGTKTYIIDVLQSGSVLALVWNNGALAGNTSCGSVTDGAVYRMKILASSFEVYKNDVLQCTQSTTGVSIDNETVYLQSSSTASVYDNVLVTGNPSGPTAPGQVTGLAADAGNTQVSLTWSAPVSNGGSAITDYLVEYKLNSEPTTWTTFADGTSTSASATVTGLTNSSLYNFRVSAINAVGTGTASSTVNATPTSPSAPGQVTGLNPTAANTQVALSWTAPSSNGSPITDYLVEYKLNSEPTTWTTFADGTSTSTSTTVTGLTNDLLYNFRVSAINGIGTGTASSTANATPVAIGVVLSDSFTGTTIDTNKWIEEDDAGAGGASGDVQQNGTLSVANSFSGAWGLTYLVSQESFDSQNLEISVDMTTGSAALFGYGDPVFGDPSSEAYLFYITGAGSGQSIMALSWTGGSYTSNSSCGTSTNGATYTMKTVGDTIELYKNDVLLCTHDANFTLDDRQVFMQSQNTASTFDNFEVYGIQVADTVPDAPTIGTATGGNQQATVTFTPPADNGGDTITGYTVTSSPGNITGTGSSSPIVVTGLTNGTSYTFTVTATNGVGTSVASSASNSVTPALPDPPTQVNGLVAQGVNQQVLLSWTAVTAVDPVTDYKVEYKLSSDSSWSTFADGTSTANKAIVTGLVNGLSYDFRVSAMNGAGYGAVSSTDTESPREITNLAFVITGESNSGGIGLNSDATAPELASRSAVQIMNLTSGQFLFENLDIGTNNLRDHDGLSGYYDNSHGFELQLANSTEAHAFPDNPTVYLTKTGHGGSQVSQWGVGQTYWTKFLQRTAAAKTQIPEDGRQWVVWMSLGINDAIAGTPTSTWKSAMIAHINKIKADLPGAIVILTQFQSMTNQSGYATYNAVMDEIAAEEPNVYVVSSTGAALRDTNHWSYAGLKTVTSRMVTITKDKLGLNNPGKVTSLSGTPSSTSVALSWTAPISNGGSSITDYVVQYKTAAASTWSTFADGTSATTGATVTGLTGGTDYNFRVATSSSAGTGNFVTANATTTDGTAPAISSVVATPGNTSASITWTTDENGSSIVDYGLTNSYGTSTVEADTTPRVTSHTVNLSGLVACTTYNYRVKSNDANSNLGTGTNNTFTTTGCTGSAEVITEESGSVATATGGDVELDNSGEGLLLDIPAGTTNTDAVFQIKQLDEDDTTATTGVPTGFLLADGHIYNLSALTGVGTAVTSFDEDIQITITYSDADVAGINESSLVIYHYSGGVWSALTPCTVDTAANTVTCSTDSFSIFALAGPAASSSSSSGSVTRHPVGTNIVDSTGTIFTLTADGKRRPYTSAGAYLSYGFNTWANVVPARSSDLSLPVGDFIPPRDGSITCSDRGSDKGTCYLITNGMKAGFVSEKVFKALGFSFQNAIYGDVSFMSSTENISDPNSQHRSGTLINNGGTLQVIKDNALAGIPSMEVLTSWGYNPLTAVVANTADKLLQQTQVLMTRAAGVLGF